MRLEDELTPISENALLNLLADLLDLAVGGEHDAQTSRQKQSTMHYTVC
jgi:hypothetical protein